MSITQKISRTQYQRPANTYQDNLTKQQIKEQLKDYKEVDDITMLSVGCHVRYFSKKLFRLGGTINKIDPEYRFIILTNGTVSWSVQIKDTKFWKKLTDTEIKEEMKEELKEEIRKEIISEENDNKKAEKEYLELKKQNSELKKQNTILNDRLKMIEKEIKKSKEKNNK